MRKLIQIINNIIVKLKGYIAKFKLWIAKTRGKLPKKSIKLYRAIKKAGLK